MEPNEFFCAFSFIFQNKKQFSKTIKNKVLRFCGHRILAMMCFPLKDETRFYF